MKELLELKQLSHNEWGWNIAEGRMVPITTDLDPAHTSHIKDAAVSMFISREWPENVRWQCRGVYSNITHLDLDKT